MQTGACPSFRQAFTLMEILIAILILGFSVSGLLNFLKWGQNNYLAINDTWHKNLLLNDFRERLRHEITAGTDISASLPRSLLDIIPRQGRLRLEKLEAKPFGTQAYFVTAAFFEDLNRNGRHDPFEEGFSRLWCFRKRTGS